MTKIIRARLDIPTPLARMGRTPEQGVPFRALEAYLDEIRAALPDEAEQKSCVVYGTENLRPEYDNHLTPSEELQLRVQALEDERSLFKALLPRDGEPLSPETLARLRQLVG